ncbi:uncharacterized protein H6S33_003229 [Morchella sextelata]|uniref:uncharacterized protein n=1 Tax=Morchella sextelata TaxID=1174677 RepID=UPI001D03D304|nr:uncharacterized protein H6S33_003229 [Morchella sextelata]KAH0607241.1 hypothetical protein H6S33_003229 [Morchella sextelata]
MASNRIMNIVVDRNQVFTPWFLRMVIVWAFKSSIFASIKERLAQGLINRTSGKRVRLYIEYKIRIRVKASRDIITEPVLKGKYLRIKFSMYTTPDGTMCSKKDLPKKGRVVTKIRLEMNIRGADSNVAGTPSQNMRTPWNQSFFKRNYTFPHTKHPLQPDWPPLCPPDNKRTTGNQKNANTTAIDNRKTKTAPANQSNTDSTTAGQLTIWKGVHPGGGKVVEVIVP